MATAARENIRKDRAGLYRTLWRYAARDRRGVVLFMTMLVLAQLLKLAIPYLSGTAVAAMQSQGNEALGAAAWDMALIFFACVASWALHGPARVLERFTAIRIRERFADSLYTTVTGLPLEWHERHHSGDTIERVQRAGSALFGFAQSQFVYLQNAVSLIGPIVAIFVISLPTGIAALLSYSLIAIVLVRFDGAMIRLSGVQNRAQAQYAATLVDCLGNIATVLMLRLAEPTRCLLGKRLASVFAPLRSSIVLNEVKWCSIDLLNNGIRCGLVMLYVWLAWRRGEALLLGSAVMVFQYAQQIGGVVGNMAGNYQDLVGYQTDLRCVEDIGAPSTRRVRAAAVPHTWREIRVEGLSFAYPRRRQTHVALSDISLTLGRGERIALVGKSGSGKSTLLRVLAGLYPAERASFAIDGEQHPAITDLGDIATLAPQDPEIFAGTIAHNLTLGIAYEPAAIHHACELAAFTPVIEALPAGLATVIAERGLNLSGGQKQRLAVARAVLAAQSSSLVLLDEPTSTLDPATEAQVYANLLSAAPDACVVSSLHRLHLLGQFDRILVMTEGRIVDSGSASELLQRQSSFRELWQHYVGDAPMLDQRVEQAPAWPVHAQRARS